MHFRSILLLLALASPSAAQTGAPAGVGRLELGQPPLEWSLGRCAELEQALLVPAEQAGAGAARLAAWGPAGLPNFYRVFVDGFLPTLGGAPGQPLDESARQVLLSAVALMGRAPVVAFLSGGPESGFGELEREAALGFLSPVGDWSELKLAFDWASGSPCAQAGAAAKLGEFLDRLLARTPSRCIDLRAHVLAAGPAEAEAALLAAGAHPCRELGVLLVRLLGQRPELDPSVLSRLGLFWKDHPGWIDGAGLNAVRELAKVGGAAIAREAISALGHARDEHSVLLFLAAIESGDRVRQITAHCALEELTGLRVRSSMSLWRRLYDRCQAWEASRSQAALEALYQGNRGEVATYLREISELRLARDRWAEVVCEVFRRGDLEMSYQAVAALRALGSPRAIPTLLEQLSAGQNLRLRDLAHQALVQISGLKLPPDVEVWRRELGLR